MRLYVKHWIPVVVATSLAGCGFSAGNIPADHFYRLPVPTPINVSQIVDVKSVQADGIYNERALLFVEQSRPLEVNRYNYHFWAQTPSALVQGWLQACLNNPHAAQAHKNGQTVIPINTVVRGFERVITNGQADVVVKLQINLHEYEMKVPAASMDMHDTVSAFGKAMQQVCEAVARDL